ncbi:MAG: acyl carrier protein [Catenulispora sp.]|nr:acyl carrier protein [Catenulispora sp.]
MTFDAVFTGVLRRRLPLLGAGEDLPSDRTLADLGLDSLNAVELLFELEDALGVALPDDALRAENFQSADSLWRTVEAARSGSAADGAADNEADREDAA